MCVERVKGWGLGVGEGGGAKRRDTTVYSTGAVPYLGEYLDGMAQSLLVEAFQGLPCSLVVGFKVLFSCVLL